MRVATHIFSAKILAYMPYLMIKKKILFNDQSFNDTLTNNIISFEQLGPDFFFFFFFVLVLEQIRLEISCESSVCR